MMTGCPNCNANFRRTLSCDESEFWCGTVIEANGELSLTAGCLQHTKPDCESLSDWMDWPDSPGELWVFHGTRFGRGKIEFLSGAVWSNAEGQLSVVLAGNFAYPSEVQGRWRKFRVRLDNSGL